VSKFSNDEIVNRLIELYEYRDGRLYSKSKNKIVDKKPKAYGDNPMKYRSIGVYMRGRERIYMFEHRIIWAICHKKMPDGCIDHLNGDTLDNRIDNLRDVTISVNRKNSYLNIRNKTGISGVFFNENTQRYILQTRSNGEMIYVGSFKTLGEAKIARNEFDAKHGFSERHGVKRNQP